jgi:hypothetical protein
MFCALSIGSTGWRDIPPVVTMSRATTGRLIERAGSPVADDHLALTALRQKGGNLFITGPKYSQRRS